MEAIHLWAPLRGLSIFADDKESAYLWSWIQPNNTGALKMPKIFVCVFFTLFTNLWFKIIKFTSPTKLTYHLMLHRTHLSLSLTQSHSKRGKNQLSAFPAPMNSYERIQRSFEKSSRPINNNKRFRIFFAVTTKLNRDFIVLLSVSSFNDKNLCILHNILLHPK